MGFKDSLCELIDKQGGRNRENLARIVKLARQVQPDISQAYLAKLMLGYRPRPEDYQALAAALGVNPNELVEDNGSKQAENRRKILAFAAERMKRPDLAADFLQYIGKDARFRNQVLLYGDLYELFHNFLTKINDDR
jgi:transcriptional regulator with XRE-family HTH domain